MDLIEGYDSGSSPSRDEEQWAAAAHRDTDESSDDESIDSATERALAAQTRLKDYGGEEQQQATSTLLPSALSAFGQVEGPPAFLDPEATRPLARAAHHLQGTSSKPGDGAAQQEQQQQQPFDIAKLAPKLKGDGAEKRAALGVIEGKAKRYKLDDGAEATQQYSAMQIAMFGGNVDNIKGPPRDPAAAGAGAGKAPTKALPVQDFLSKGLGGAQLPRQQQDRKDKEKKKRTLGQSTHSHWKSEAEMVLRQQFD